jgi:flavorubredoxin
VSDNLFLFDDGTHRNIMLKDFGLGGLAVQANQHLIIHGTEGMLLDPGGHKVYAKALGEVMTLLGSTDLRRIFLSHQDPDIVAAINGWLMTTDAEAHVSSIWLRFVAHFGLDQLVEDRLKPIPDEGMHLDLGGVDMVAIPAHFLHAAGNFQLYDPVSKILYSGDLGASLGMDYLVVTDFEAHIPYMKDFHQRYMASNEVMRAWADMVSTLDIETIAPQHGALFVGRDMVKSFISWCSELRCGVDLAKGVFKVPTA